MDYDILELASHIKAGDRAALSRAITLSENDLSAGAVLLKMLGKPARSARKLGLTGPPGVGKSTLAGSLIPRITADGFKLGAILVDPTSPITSGAVLGDRIRLGTSAYAENVFVRSIATRGSKGGLTLATPFIVRLLEHWGAEVVLIETVGAGQIGTDAAGIADFLFLVLAPGSGDYVQTLKAGIFELADVFVVNKSDLPGASILVSQLEELADGGTGQSRSVIAASAKDGVNVESIWLRFLQLTEESGKTPDRVAIRRLRIRLYLEELIGNLFTSTVLASKAAECLIKGQTKSILDGETDLLSAAMSVFREIAPRI